MKHLCGVAVVFALCFQFNRSLSQDFTATPIPISQPDVLFALKTPIVHLQLNEYIPSARTVYAGSTTFKLNTHPRSDIFLKLRWDMDASDGISFSDWYTDQNNPAVVTHSYTAPGKHTITFEIKMYNILGQEQTATKTAELFVVPFPTSAYKDGQGNRLYYWEGSDGVYDKPVLYVEGYDPLNENIPSSNYAVAFDLAEIARTQGYDILLLDYADGGADIRENKDVFLGACTFAHDKLLGLEAPVQVIGVSMGGVVARFGLAWAEDNARHENEPRHHFVNTFISFDSPQQGAHVNNYFQDFIRDRGAGAQGYVLQTPAAKQMLYYDSFGSKYAEFYTEMQALNNMVSGYTNGYPRRSKNFSVSNGNFNADYPAKTAGVDPLAVLTIYKSIDLFFINLEFLLADEVIEIPSEQRDLWPGSTFTNDLRLLNSSGTVQRFLWPGLFFGLFSWATGDWNFNVRFNPSYQPTESALDLKDYARTADGSIVGGSSWFDDHLVQTTFHRHEELTEDSKSKVMNWLNSNRTYAYLGSPSELKATVQSSSPTIKLTFHDNAILEQGFVIERRSASGTYAEIARTAPNIKEYVDADPNLLPYESYFYRIRAFSGSRYSDGPTETSVYFKPQRTSTSASVLANTNQQKIMQFDGTYQLVYESGNEIWFASSHSIIGSSWNDEIRLSDGSGSSRSPSLNCYRGADGVSHVEVVWIQNNQIVHRERTGPSNWLASTQVSGASIPGGYDSAPVIGQGWLAYNVPASGSSGSRIVLAKRLASGSWKTDIPPIPGMSTDSRKPAILTTDNTCHLVWADASTGNIMHNYLTSPNYAWQSVSGNLSASSGRSSNQNPTIAGDDGVSGQIFVAWNGLNSTTGQHEVMVRRRVGGTWEPSPTYFPAGLPCPSGTGYANPVVRYLGISADCKMGISWRGTDNTLWVARYVLDGSWKWKTYSVGQSSNQVPTLSNNEDGSLTKVLYVQNSQAPPYSLVLTSVSSSPFIPMVPSLIAPASGGQAELPAVLSWNCVPGAANYRIAVAEDPEFNETVSQLVVTEPTAQVSGLRYNRTYYWHVRSQHANGNSDYSETSSFSTPPQPGVTLSWSTVLVNGIKNPKLSWVPVGQNTSITKLHRTECGYGGSNCGSPVLIYSGSATAFTDISVVVAGKNDNPTKTFKYTATMSNLSNTVSVNSTVVQKEGAGDGDIGLPVVTMLHANYPNPFNPRTTIRYDIAAPGSRVEMSVFDVLGREVARLVDGELSPGSYESNWNAEGASAGLYYLRMSVVSSVGSQTYQEIRKMLLLK